MEPRGLRELKVAVVGAGPAGFFATAELLRRADLKVQVDMFDRLPTPYGLVRHGVAPDHQSIKAIAHRYAKDAEGGGTRFRLFGNVTVGRDVAVEELRERYHAIVFAFGAQSNRRLGIPGEELYGVHPASVFVGWYNGHPDCIQATYDFQIERSVVVGVGNVGLDVARVLLKSQAQLRRTDISDVALEALRSNEIREVVILGRHTQAQATYTPSELEELAHIEDCDFVVAPRDRELDELTTRHLADGTIDPRVKKNLQIVEQKALTEPRPGRKFVRLRYFASPLEVVGEGRVEGLRIAENHVFVEDGEAKIERTPYAEVLPCGQIFRSIGYKVDPLPGVPYDESTSSVPHEKGQILDLEGRPVPGFFVTGWAKRGPTGVIGTNKPDATETVALLFAAQAQGALGQAPLAAGVEGEIVRLLAERQVQYVSFPDWKLLDQIEVFQGKASDRPRRKFTDVPTMLKALAETKMGALPHEDLAGTGG
jgi:ferredoxin--NADP+ reductase